MKGVTYIPIPSAAGKNFAGLFTVDVPLGVKRGQQFNILVRRLATKMVEQAVIEDAPRAAVTAPADRAPVAARSWRYVTGAFQVAIQVQSAAELLGPEENTLAIFKARLQAMSPAYRWYPVLQRYINYIAGMIDGLNGNAASIPASLLGYAPRPLPVPHPGKPGHTHEHRHRYFGKIGGLAFDRFGDFEGFLLDTEHGEHSFVSREREMKELVERAWRERLFVTVTTDDDQPRRPHNVILRLP